MSDKTLVDVADRTLDQLSDGVKSLTHAFESLAPQAWNMLVTKQRWDGYLNVALISIMIIASVILVSLFKFVAADESEDSKVFKLRIQIVIIGMIGSITITGSIIMMFNLPDYIQHIINPEYFAAQEMMHALGR